MTQEHPITPPPELVKQWYQEWTVHRGMNRETHVATEAARWGADQELEACCEWLKGHWLNADLRAHRRPKPPSLKEQALKELQMLCDTNSVSLAHLDTIRRALESLPDQ